MDVYSLSDLGFRTDESTMSCVIIGSFWNAQSQMFSFCCEGYSFVCMGASAQSIFTGWKTLSAEIV